MNNKKDQTMKILEEDQGPEISPEVKKLKDSLKNEVNLKNGWKMKFQKSEKENEELNDDAKKSKNLTSQYKSKNKTLRVENERLQQELQKKSGGINSKPEVERKLRNEVEELVEDIKRLDAENEELKKQLEAKPEPEAAVTEIEDTEKEYLKKSVSALQDLVKDRDKQITVFTGNLERTFEKLETSRACAKEMTNIVGDLSDENTKLKDAIAQMAVKMFGKMQ